MKRVFFSIFVIFAAVAAFSSPAHAAAVEVNVNDIVASEFKESHEMAGTLLDSFPEIYNSGSVPYAARIKISVYDGGDEVFFGWSKKESVMPGERKSFRIFAFAYPASAGKYLVKLSVHYANSAFNQKEYYAAFESPQNSSREIILSKPRVYENKITLDVSSPAGEKGVVLLPLNYPKTWVFEEKELSSISKGKKVRLTIPYEPDIFIERNVSVIAITKDGAFGEITFPMKREQGASKFISLLLDWVAGAK